MADIKNYTLNFGSGQALRALDFARVKSTCAEVQRADRVRSEVLRG